ncbi:hypothetical protein FBU59_003439 [Linderina macrospora]|uniref:Uncharacterized protein n=1 Tax=Linderina macrospora TaxID=4868 RepID=A0ACC1J8J2_9FUNG|nr:hypothetical protein FBU59_003439 [Linderina macrospora]
MTEQRSRLRHPKYKTSLCKDFPLGKCTFGMRCNFAHSLDELRMGLLASQGAGPAPNQAVLQTPVTMLADGRMLSTFTPVAQTPDNPSPAAAVAAAAANAAVMAGQLRRQTSLNVLTGGHTADSQSIGIAHAAPSSATTPHQQYAHPSPKSFTGMHSHGASGDMSQSFGSQRNISQPQQLHYLHQERVNVARRVSSLSQLPTFKSPQVHSGASVANQSYMHMMPNAYHASPLSHVPPLATPVQSELGNLGDLPYGMGNSQHYYQQPRRTLTSSISMQSLPRYKMQTNWDQPIPAASTMGLSSLLQPSLGNQITSSSLIDQDVWSSSNSGYGADPAGLTQESRFFPSATNLGTSVASTATIGSMLGGDSLGIHYPAGQLRRQQSKEDWTSMRQAYPSPVHTMPTGYFAESPKAESRYNSLEQLRAATTSRKQFQPFNDSSALCL